MAVKKLATVASSAVPQFDSLERILEALRILVQGSLTADTIDLSPRHINYVKQAARVLGLVSPDGGLTTVGRRAVTLSDAPLRRLLREQFENSECGRAWLSWAGATNLDSVDPNSSEAFLEARSDFPEAMVKRRGRTLRRWCAELQSRRDAEGGNRPRRRGTGAGK